MDDRTSVWSIGLGLGLSTCGGLLLTAALRHLPWDWSWLAIGVSLIVMCWAGLPVAVWSVGIAWSIMARFYTWWHRNDVAARPPSPPAAPQAAVVRQVNYTVNGRPQPPLEVIEPRPPAWTAWQRESLALLDWYTTRRSLACEALTGPGLAFASRPEWVAFTDEWARAGLANKANGRRTTLALPLPVVRDRLTRGMVEWRTDSAPPPVASPFPAASVVVEHVAA